MVNVINEMRCLIDKINKASEAYYLHDAPIMSDKEYDDLCDKLERLEADTGFVLSSSPIHKVQGMLLDGLEKVEHTKPMLSADKTKDMDEIKRFIADQDVVQSWKLDGLTVVARYYQGKLQRAITRGNGEIGEDVTEAFKHCINIPLAIPVYEELEVRGECVISWDNFNKINEGLEEPYSHPRNLAAGSLRSLDTNVAKDRFLEYKAFELVEYNGEHMDVFTSFTFLSALGFDVVEHYNVCSSNFAAVDEAFFNPERCDYPVDGTIYKYDSYKYGESLGTTAHHPLNMIARKWQDDVYETELVDIDWTMGKTGVLTPTAMFKPVEIDGSIVERASVHNLSILNQLDLRRGDRITVYKSNMIIPQVFENIDAKNREDAGIQKPDWNENIPACCPYCGYDTTISTENSTSVLVCENQSCSGKKIGKLAHFCSRDAMNIEGLSESKIARLSDLGFLSEFSDFYTLKSKFYDEIVALDGFGKKSADNLMDAIEKSRHTTLDRFIYALCIPYIGRTASKTISKRFGGDFRYFYYEAAIENFDFTTLDGFGDVMANSISDYINCIVPNNAMMMVDLSKHMDFQVPERKDDIEQCFEGKTFVITGSLEHFSNRNEAKKMIEDRGGKVSGSVSKNTSYLVNNDIESTSGKNKKAKELGIPIISEKKLMEMAK